jgi:hypothetical protein
MKAAWLFPCILLVACSSSPTEPIFSSSPPTLQVKANGTSLELVNFSDRPAFFFIHERESAALINWWACADATRCDFVGGRSRIRVPYSRIGMYQPGKQEAIVWWWESLGGGVAGRVHALVVRL